MKQTVAEFIADFMVSHQVVDCFTVTGGGAMYLNDAFGHKEGMHCLYNHHEQASAMAAEAYARLNNRPALLCVTTGPGGTNAITGVVGGWLDSIPMIIISGQVRYDTTRRYNEQFTDGHPLRSVGDQEFDIIQSVSCMCKYATMIEDPNDILYALEKAYDLACSGRPGPCWLDIPLNIQNAIIETDDLRHYAKDENQALPPRVDEFVIDTVIDKIKQAKRPVLYAGNGIRLANAYDVFRDVIEALNIPICTYWDSVDLIETEHPLYVGRGGNMGDRPGNFAIQNADLVLAIGNRLPIRAVGYRWDTWAREAEVIMVDIDQAELKKPTIHVEMPIWADAKDFLELLQEKMKNEKNPIFQGEEWLDICKNWKEKYPVVLERHWQDAPLANPYASFDYLSRQLPEGSLTVTSNGTCCVVGHQTWFIKKGTRFFNNNAIASMGYGLPASIGACIANQRKQVLCLEGDGSIMMNLQELQTIVTNKLPIKIVLINNDGYHSIRQTQNNLFHEHTKVGIGPESGDLSFPSFEKIANAFGIPYLKATNNEEMQTQVDALLELDSYAMLEIFVSSEQIFEPKSSAKRLEDGRLISPPLEDLAPFLSREELKENMLIEMVDEADE